MLLLLTLGSGGAWGQTDHSGVYYIKHNADKSYYLCTSTVFYDGNHYANSGDMPYLTTAKTGTIADWENEAVWRIIKAESGNYYYVVHAIDGKYLTLNDDPTDFVTNNSNPGNRLSLHLQNLKDEEKSLFKITKSGNWYNISPKSKDIWSLNPAGNNFDTRAGDVSRKQKIGGQDKGVGGIIGLWVNDNAYSKWQFQEVTGKPICDAPTFTNNGTVSISCSTDGATIYYTTDGSTVPTTSSTNGNSITVTEDINVIWARATTQNSEPYYWSPLSVYVIPQCPKPVISIINGKLNLSCVIDGATFHYTINGTDPTTEYDPNNKPDVTEDDIIKAVATKNGYHKSNVASTMPPQTVHNTSEIDNMYGHYILASDFAVSSSVGTQAEPFCGVIDGGLNTFSDFDKALVAYANGATIRNVILDNVTISGNGNGNAGAICCEATGDTRIYNCGVKSGTISGTNAGSIVGKLNGNSRVINCYSFATVSGGTWGAGIVGYNNFSSTISDLRTMVMNCMFYGEISSNSNLSPIYGGKKITNVGNLNGYNYYRFNANYSRNNNITDYNCAQAAEEDYLTRFEFFRNTLNSNRELAAWYATDNPNNGKGIGNACKMAKWVLDPADKPYPILKTQDYYPSVINYEDAPTLGTIDLTISESNDKPSGASINSNYPTTLTVYDKDLDHKHFNYRTVRLPYYNEVGTGNCTKNKVVTGWKITGFSGGTQGHFVNNTLDYSGTTHGADEYPPYNFADRYCTDKDKYEVSGRVFSQGAYYDVPEGVTGITIEPYWGTAVYLSDPTYDVAYPYGYGDKNANAVFVSNMGVRYVNDNKASINDDNQKVYTNYKSAYDKVASSGTVYDNAIVLVGNYHHYWGPYSPSSGKAFTIMSADLNNDCEPDYSFIVQHGTNRQDISAIRFDFINSPGLGMIQKVETDKAIPKHGIWHPKGWFEVTNTTLIQFTQFEYDKGGKSAGSPLILLGGIYDQFITARQNVANSTEYIHLGSNIWMKEFCNGVHTNAQDSHTTRHIPISVTGGEFESFYLTGTFRPSVNSVTDNAECYINGGKFGDMAGAGQEQLKGDVTWLIDHADITNFYGGGINDQKPVLGHIYVEINNSNVGLYCGGPKFGNMQADMKVTTKAKGSTFGNFYGAGYGGTSYYRDMTRDVTGGNNWNSWNSDYTRKYVEGKGISTEYEYEFIPYSGGQSGQHDYVGRFYVLYASLSLAKTKDVESTLEDCHITGSFYGGGKLGSVDGNITSTLKNCTVDENVFGAGFSASVEKVNVVPKGAKMNPNPSYNESVGVFTDGVYPDGVEYTWTHAESVSAGNEFDNDNHLIYTTTNLTGLGVVTGSVTLTIDGNTTLIDGKRMSVGKSVYGGGEESGVDKDTEVYVKGGTIGTQGQGGAEYGNVYGGGKGKSDDVTAGLVKGNTNVNISGSPRIWHNVYGGGAYGSVGTFTYDANNVITGHTANTGKAKVTITGGTFGWNGKENGMVFGSSRGDVGAPGSIDDKLAWVYDTEVKIGTEGSGSVFTTPVIKGSVYGGGENGHNYHDAAVYIYSGTVGIPTGETIVDNNGTPSDTSDDVSYSGAQYPYRGNVYGGGCGTDKYYSGAIPEGHTATDGNGDSYNPLAGIVQGTTAVNISGGFVVHHVYGAGAMGSVGTDTDENSGKTTINISGGRIGYDGNRNGNVFGAARGEYGISVAGSGLANVRETEVNIQYDTTPTADNEEKTVQLIASSVFGGGESGTVKESVAVNMTGGLILKDIYGGGALADTQTSNWDASANSGAGNWATGKSSSSATTTVRLTGGRIGEEVFGGGLGEAGKPAYVWGDVLVDLNGTTPIDPTTHKPSTTGTATTNASGCVVGQVFGGNNVNGTPKGDVMVHIYATQNAAATQIANTTGENPVTNAKVKGRYDVTAVYGGGNQAAYNPVTPHDGTSGAKTQVLIEGCALTSINTVYGGGNAAAVPETNVTIKGAYEIGYLFGGGNGKDDIAPGVPNPGADIGTLDQGTTTYGTGNANTTMVGGLIHEAYGGSNQKGIIKGSINQITDPKESTDPEFCCELEVDKIVGAGKYADIDGDVNMTLSCQPNKKVNELFAGADEANVNGNITLNITNGHFGNVFGGNNLGGAVKGKITVNVEETGCQPIKIDNLYLGGNEAAYSVFGYYESEDTHPVTGKKILKPRESANDSHTPVANPATDATHTFPYAQPELNIISCTYIGNVFCGGLGEPAKMYANPTVNVNLEQGLYYNDATVGVPKVMTELGLDASENPGKLGIIRNVYGGGNAADIEGNTTVNIATVEGKSAYIIGSVFGGGNAADVLGNTNVTMSGGYVFNGVFGGGYAGSVGKFTRSTAATDVNVYGHRAHDGCIGKPTACEEGTGLCTVVVNGGQIGPISVATQGMNRPEEEGGPVPQGWVWGGGQGLVEDPADHPDTHFSSYVGSTDVTIGGNALIMESIIGGGEFGRVLGSTLVKIEGGQIGVGAGKVDADNKPIRYADDDFINPSTATAAEIEAAAAKLAECSHFPYGEDTNNDGIKDTFLPYDLYYDTFKDTDYIKTEHPDLSPASTASPSDGKTWIGCVFGGGSGYMSYLKKDNNGNPVGYDWCSSAGLVEGDTEVRISGGHILTNVYGGNEVTNVKGKCKVTMTGGTIGVPRTVEQIIAHPLTCYLFGAGKGDQRPHFNTETNVGEVEIDISGGIIYGSVFGGGEDGHVQRDVKMTIGKDDHTGPVIGTWGTSYVDGNVFGGGRGFGGDAYTAGNVAGSVDVDIKGGNILGSIYGGGRLGSVGYGLYPPTAGAEYYGAMRPDNTGDDVGNTHIDNFKRGYVDIEISGGTIGNTHEYIIPSEANTPTGLNFANIATWTDDDWKTWTSHNNIPLTEFDKETYRLKHTKGGNVFTGGMGRLYQLDGKTPISTVDWWKLGCVKQTKLTVKGGTIKSNIYGGGELGAVKPYVSGETVQGGTTEIYVQNANNTQIGTEVKDGSNATQYTFGSVYGGGYGSTIENLNGTDDTSTENDNPKFVAGLVHGNTKIDMQAGKVLASVYGGGEVASVNGSAEVAVSGGEVGKDKVGTKMFGGPTMGNVYGGGSGHPNIVRCGRILNNTKVTISGDDTKIYHNVYGGGAYGTVGDFTYTTGNDGKVNGVSGLRTANTGKAEVKITGGTIGSDGKNNGMVFGSSRGDINKTGERDDHTAWVYDAFVTIGTQGSETGPDIKGSIYGSGENGHTFHNTDVKIHSGKIGIDDVNDPDGGAAYAYRGNVYGGGCGTDKYYSNTSLENHDGNGDTYNPLAGIVYGNTAVTIDGGTVVRNVYGAGAMGSVGKTTGGTTTDGKTTINISGGTIGVSGTVGDGNVYGAARGDINDNTTGLSEVQETEVNIKPNAIDGKPEATIKGSVFGGGEAGIVKGAVAVSVFGGNVLQDVYGGGALADTNTDNWGTDTWASGKSSASNTTTVNLTGGKINHNVYGGALGQIADTESGKTDIEAKVYGDVQVELNNGVADDAKGCVVLGSIFGCNNLNGTPKGDVKVHIYKTQNNAATRITNPTETQTAKVTGRYDVAAVYGGGNQSAYEPADLTGVNKTEVIIDGCGSTSIRQVYGGGNAACTPATNVTVNGTFEVEELFGGGNGLDNILINGVEMPNPGANVGYKNYSEYYQDGTTWKVRDKAAYDTKEERMASTSAIVYGTGKASVNLFGGTVHRVFGGSNTKGNVRQTAITLLDDNGGCDFCVDEAYGGGKSAEMDAEAKLLMACIPGLEAVYGGAEAADVHGNVTLNITNGTFNRVFGGNNLSGTINGSITVNIEEIGCKPIKIGELYGGGNEAGYSVYGYDSDGKPVESGTTSLYDDPQVNVMSFTSIGNIYGGGYGEGATLVGNPTVNINEAYGKYYNDNASIVGENAKTPGNYPIPSHAKGKMGAINNVFGGGNAAKVIGNPTVNIGTLSEVYVVKEVTSGTALPAECYTRNNDGTYSAATGTAEEGKTYYEKKDVKGADIRGNVYGGGNNAEVTGNTNVVIGKKNESQ